MHLGGSFPMWFLETIATEIQLKELQSCIEAIKTTEEYSKAFRIFDLVADIVRTDEMIQEGTLAVYRSLALDSVKYCELRYGLFANFSTNRLPHKEYIPTNC